MNTKTTVISQEQLDAQFGYCDAVAALWARQGITPVAYVETYGCQQNEADSEKLRGYLAQCGYAIGSQAEGADVVIMNTCAIREHAEQRVFGNLGALTHTKRRHPGQKIFLCGCMAGEEKVSKRVKESYPHVDGVFSTHHLWQFPEILYNVLTKPGRVFYVQEEPGSIAEGIPQVRDSGLKAWVSIMYGCNNFCTYCIVPYVRGRERSRRPECILEECRGLIENGAKEITLLGQNVNSYGKGLPEKVNFSELLRRIDAIDGDYRLRFMTSHPKDATHELFDTIAESRHICHYIHLPCQSGSSRVLKAMNRHYDREKYLDLIRYAKEKMPDLSLTSDIIVGFPGETYEEFCETLSLIREVEFTSLFTFIFSPRPGTRAAEMEDPVTYKEKTQWFSELLKTQEEIAAKRCASMVGSTERVLIEERNEKNGLLSGRTASSIIVEFPGEDEWIGEFKNVKVTEARNWILRGECVD